MLPTTTIYIYIYILVVIYICIYIYTSQTSYICIAKTSASADAFLGNSVFVLQGVSDRLATASQEYQVKPSGRQLLLGFTIIIFWLFGGAAGGQESKQAGEEAGWLDR